MGEVREEPTDRSERRPMRALIRKDNVKIEFSGRGQVWNEMLRPWLGGPQAPDEAEQQPAPAPASGFAQPTATVAARPVPASVAQPVSLASNRMDPSAGHRGPDNRP